MTCMKDEVAFVGIFCIHPLKIVYTSLDVHKINFSPNETNQNLFHSSGRAKVIWIP